MNNKRTFGWVQNPASFENLKNLVSLFLVESTQYKKLLNDLQPEKNHLIQDNNVKTKLREALSQTDRYHHSIRLGYAELVGSGSSDRKSAPCSGLGQGVIKPQSPNKLYTDNWTTDGFVRWAECLGFIQYHSVDDSFTLTEEGYVFATWEDDFPSNPALQKGLLSYPPVHRVLSELCKAKEVGLSKHEIGRKLGFYGESGFTSISYALIVDTLQTTDDEKFIKKLRSDIEGTSDKYARMISGWLVQMGWVRSIKRTFENKTLNKTIKLGHCFAITLKGHQECSRIHGNSKHPAIKKRMSWYMLATNAQNRDYLRTRRYLVLKKLQDTQGKGDVTLEQLLNIINDYNRENGIDIRETRDVINKDLAGLRGCGLFIEQQNNTVNLVCKLEKLPDLEIKPEIANIALEKLKHDALQKYAYLEPEWIELIEISRNAKQSRIFEMKVAELFETYYRVESRHLGGASKPDCILWDPESAQYAIILDTKAYKDGFPCPVSELDKMTRYLRENTNRNAAENPNKWWENFPTHATESYFLFVSSTFAGRIANKMSRIFMATENKGAAWDVENLLYGANFFASNEDAQFADYCKSIFNNDLVDSKAIYK